MLNNEGDFNNENKIDYETFKYKYFINDEK